MFKCIKKLTQNYFFRSELTEQDRGYTWAIMVIELEKNTINIENYLEYKRSKGPLTNYAFGAEKALKTHYKLINKNVN